MKFVKNFIPHLAIAFLLGLAVLVILDDRNPMMSFLTSFPSKIFILCACFSALTACMMLIIERRK